MTIDYIAQKYKVIKELGAGHSGTVYLALTTQGKEVAIKCLTAQYNEADLKRFQQEFVTLRSLTHLHIAQPIDFGYDSKNHQYFFVAEYIQGTTLNKACVQKSQRQILNYFSQCLKALDYMHRQGLYHCDLKPANILVTSKGVVKIIDFDVATRGTKVLGGTPSFFPPELLADPTIQPNPKADLYSLGATFYRCLTGQRPFPASNIDELRLAHINFQPLLPSEIEPRLGTTWDGLLMGLIQTNPSHRYSTASAVLQQVLPLLGNKKTIFSEKDINYRLNQHGIPVGKKEFLIKADLFLKYHFSQSTTKKRTWLIESSPGAGISYLLKEIKTLAQLQGLQCVTWNQYQKDYPENFPFVWFVDDLSKRQQDDLQWSSKLKEIYYKGENKAWWVILGGISQTNDIPYDLQPILNESADALKLELWDKEQIKLWLQDIFQTSDIPSFLIGKLYHETKGNPQKTFKLLRYYLDKKLIINRLGHWRKDLYKPSPLFVKEFTVQTKTNQQTRFIESLTDQERKLILTLSLLYEAMPGDFFEGYFETNTIFKPLHKFQALGLVTKKENTYQMSDSFLKNQALKYLGIKKAKLNYDQLTKLATQPGFHHFFSMDALHYYKAHGSNSLMAADGWNYFGDLYSHKGLWDSAYHMYSQAYSCTPSREIHKKFEYAVKKGKCFMQLGSLNKAQIFFEKLLIQFKSQAQTHPEYFAKIYERLGLIAIKNGNLNEARQFFNKGVHYLKSNYNPLEQYVAIKNFLASLDLMQGDTKKAIQEYQDNEKLTEKLPIEKRRILTNNDLGAALMKDGQVQKALDHWHKLIHDLSRREDKTAIVRCYFQMGQAYLENGEDALALKYLEKALHSSRGLQNYEMELRIYNALANVYNKKEKEKKALEMYEKALDCSFQVSDPFSTTVILINMGTLLAESHQLARAKHTLSQALIYLSGITNSAQNFANLYRIIHTELAKISTELLLPEEALHNAEQAQKLIETHQELEKEKTDTLLALWQVQDVFLHKDEAKKTELQLRKLTDDKEFFKKMNETEMKNQALRLQLKKLGKSEQIQSKLQEGKTKLHDQKTITSDTATTVVIEQKNKPKNGS